MHIESFWRDVLNQDANAIKDYFHESAYINWHCTDEHFTVDEFIRANCEYPGEWDGKVERAVQVGNLVITVTHVYSKDQKLSFHVTSFFEMKDGKIAAIDEYWADDGPAPQWRQDMHLGEKIPCK